MKIQLLSVVGLLASGALARLLSLDEESFEEVVIKSGKPSFVKFYAPWCFHCKQMAQTWEDLADTYEGEDVQIVEIDADMYKGVRSRYGISSFPQVKLFKPDQITVPIDYEGGRNIEEFSQFINSELALEGEVKKPSMVVQFNDINAEKFIEVKDKKALLLFTEPECQECDELLEKFEAVANAFHRDNNKVLIGEVKRLGSDPTDFVRGKFHIGHYPSIVYVENGNMDKYEFWDGDLEVETFVKYVNAKVGIKRGVDGFLEQSAGIIEEIDESLREFVGRNVFERREMIDDFVAQLRKVDVVIYQEELKYYAVALNQFNSNNQKFFITEKAKYEKMLLDKTISSDMKDSASLKLNFLNHCEQFYTNETWRSMEELSAERDAAAQLEKEQTHEVIRDEL